MEHRLSFSCDYLEGAHPAILQRLCETNFAQTAGYGTDEYCESAREKIRAACGAPNAEIHFLVGGTQTNATVIDALLRSYEGVIAADTGHISVHEAGAIEFGGHKVLTLPQENGKITASQIRALLDQYEDDANRDHTVMPGMVYLSQPTEYGTLYSRKELAAISALCREKRLPLYIDGARLAYALACPENDVTLRDLAAAFGEERRLSLSRELTKLHEQTLRMTLGEAMRYFDENAPRGEFVLIVEGAPDEPETEQSEEERLAAAAEAVRRRIEQGQTQKDAVKAVSAEVGVKKNALYRYVLENE